MKVLISNTASLFWCLFLVPMLHGSCQKEPAMEMNNANEEMQDTITNLELQEQISGTYIGRSIYFEKLLGMEAVTSFVDDTIYINAYTNDSMYIDQHVVPMDSSLSWYSGTYGQPFFRHFNYVITDDSLYNYRSIGGGGGVYDTTFQGFLLQ